jgi:hypothetical protein
MKDAGSKNSPGIRSGLIKAAAAAAIVVAAYYASVAAAKQPDIRGFLESPILGTLVVEKQTSPEGHPDSFAFIGAFVGTLSDGQTEVRSVEPGLYSVTEEVPPNWRLIEITCDDPASSGDVTLATATYAIAEDQTVTCTFHNLEALEVFLPLIINQSPAAGSAQIGEGASRPAPPGHMSP